MTRFIGEIELGDRLRLALLSGEVCKTIEDGVLDGLMTVKKINPPSELLDKIILPAVKELDVNKPDPVQLLRLAVTLTLTLSISLMLIKEVEDLV